MQNIVVLTNGDEFRTSDQRDARAAARGRARQGGLLVQRRPRGHQLHRAGDRRRSPGASPTTEGGVQGTEGAQARGRMRSTRTKWAWRIAPLALALLAVGGYGLFARAGGAARPRHPPPPPRPTPVVVAPVRTRDVGVYLTGLGTVTPLNTVTVQQPRRRPADERRLPARASSSSAGDLLAEIDPRPFQAQLDPGRGPARPGPGAARQRAARSRALPRRCCAGRSIAEQQLDTQASLVRQDEGAVKTDQGQIDSAEAPAHLLPHHLADHRPRRACGWWTPATSCTPPTPTASS